MKTQSLWRIIGLLAFVISLALCIYSRTSINHTLSAVLYLVAFPVSCLSLLTLIRGENCFSWN
jgi:hypothetical protein